MVWLSWWISNGGDCSRQFFQHVRRGYQTKCSAAPACPRHDFASNADSNDAAAPLTSGPQVRAARPSRIRWITKAGQFNGARFAVTDHDKLRTPKVVTVA